MNCSTLYLRALTVSPDCNQLCQNHTSIHFGLSGISIRSQCLYAVTLPKKRHYSRFLSFRRSCPPHLAMQTEEQITSDYLLKIFRACIPHMPKTAAKFGQELQLALQPMILKPSSAGGVAVGHLPVYTCSQC
jgi:hypothetical protein